MLDIMKSEFYKVCKSKVTFVTVLCLLGISAIEIGAFLYGKLAGGFWGEALSDTKGVEIYAGFTTGSFYLIFVALFVGGMISNEYTNRTVRQVVSRGASRVQIAFGQFISLATVMTIITVIPAALSSLTASLCWEFGSISVQKFLLILLGQIVVIWSYSAITMLIAHLTRSGGLSIGINIMLLLGGAMAVQVLTLLTEKDFFMTYWIENMQQNAVYPGGDTGTQVKCIIILTVIGVVFTILGIVRFKIKDVD